MNAAIMGFLSLLIDPIKSFFTNRKELAMAKHTRDLAILQSQAKLAEDKQSFDHAWEMASLQDKDKGLRYLSFFMFTSPIIITVLAPVYGFELFERLELVPEWILQIWFYMIAGIWGLASLKDTVPQIIQGMRRSHPTNTKDK